MLKFKSVKQWSILLLSLSVMSLLFQNCSSGSSSSSPNSASPKDMIYAESISQLTLVNNSAASEVKDSYLYVGDSYSVGFLNQFVQSGAELIIEIESSSTATCSFKTVTNSKQAYIGSCSEQGILDVKITFNNPGKPSAIEKRHFFVIKKITAPPLDPPVETPPISDPNKATSAYLNYVGFSIGNHTSGHLKELKLYYLKYESSIQGSGFNRNSIRIVKSDSSTANCTLSLTNSAVPEVGSPFKASYSFLCNSSGTLKFEIKLNNESQGKYVEYKVEVPTANETDFSADGVFLYASYLPQNGFKFLYRTIYPHLGSAFDLFSTMDSFEYGVYTNALLYPSRVKFEVLSSVANPGSAGLNCSFDPTLKPDLKPNALGTLKCKGYGTVTIKISYLFGSVTLSKTSTHSIY